MQMKCTGLRTASAVVAFAMGMGWSAAVTAQAPLGHRDFYPSADRPVGWRGDGNGAFPGATPVTQWRDGDLEPREVEIERWGDAGGNVRGTYERRKVRLFANRKTVNIAWKTEMPGFANSSPIAVGDRIFTTAEPNWLICVDAHTGRILWQRAINPFEAMGLSPEEVKRNNALLECDEAVKAVTSYIVGNYGRVPPRYMTAGHWRKWRGLFLAARKATEPAVAWDQRGDVRKVQGQIDAVVAELDKLIGGQVKVDEDNRNELAAGLAKSICGIAARGGAAITAWMAGEYGFLPIHHWGGWVGWTFGTPVSDGRHVYVSMGQLQAACLDLDGRVVWARSVPHPRPGLDRAGRRQRLDPRDLDMVCSPLLIGDVLAVQRKEGLVGLDKKTGSTLWEAPAIRSNGCGTHRVVRLAGGLDVIACMDGQVVDPRTGKRLCDLGMSQLMAESLIGFGGTVIHFPTRPNVEYGPMINFRLKASGRDALAFERVWETPRARVACPSKIHTGRFIVSATENCVYDAATGKKVLQESRGQLIGGVYVCPILAGRYVVSLLDAQGHRELRLSTGQEVVQCLVSELGADGSMTKVSDDNWLGGDDKPRMPVIEKYFPEAYKSGFWGQEGAVPNQFGYGSPFAQGNRIFYRSCTHLYCIGDPNVPYDWNPASRPKEVADALTGGPE